MLEKVKEPVVIFYTEIGRSDEYIANVLFSQAGYRWEIRDYNQKLYSWGISKKRIEAFSFDIKHLAIMTCRKSLDISAEAFLAAVIELGGYVPEYECLYEDEDGELEKWQNTYKNDGGVDDDDDKIPF